MIKVASLVNLLGYVIGGIGGIIYFKFFPCETGCAIRSNIIFNILIGALIGDLIFQLVKKFITQKN
jgi:hypothetical protein